MPKFITLAGKKQVGKDTSAHIIKEILDIEISKRTYEYVTKNNLHGPTGFEPRVHIVHFADALKEACALIFGIDRQDMETEEGKRKLTDVVWPLKCPAEGWGPYIDESHGTYLQKKFMTVRELLQFVGTDLFRNQIDPDIWVKSVFKQKYGENDIVIIADARFPNEASFAKKNGLLVKIERQTNFGQDAHISEKALDNYTDFDEIVDNNGDMGCLVFIWKLILGRYGFIS